MAIWLVRSSASTSFSGTPYSAARSKEPGRPARRMTSPVFSIVSNRPLPSSPLTTRVIRFETIALR